MPPSTSSTPSNGTTGPAILTGSDLPPNIVKINDDVATQLDTTAATLRYMYQKQGYGGVSEWIRDWKELVDTVLRVYNFGLLTATSRAKALRACDACLSFRIAVDDIYFHASRLRAVLDPETEYNDWYIR